MSITLWGEYHPPASPLAQRRLSVSIHTKRGTVAFGGRVIAAQRDEADHAFDAIVDAEDLVAQARAVVAVGRSSLALEYEIAFEDGRGAPYTLELVQRFDDTTLRTLTELSGTLLDAERLIVANARLRIDYRDLIAAWSFVRAYFSPHT